MNYLSIENLTHSFGEKKLFENISFGLDKGQKLALIAKNGSGKSTLMKILNGKIIADRGKCIVRNGITLGYLEQSEDFSMYANVFDAILDIHTPQAQAFKIFFRAEESGDSQAMEDASAAMNETNAWDFEQNAKSILSKLSIRNLNQDVNSLSGGQKKRIALAKVLIAAPDILLLDEPTNHLDLDMIEWLENYLNGTEITLFMVTHDRYFLERICDEILEMDAGNLYRYKGNYSFFLEKKAEREMAEASTISKAKNLFRKELDWMRRMPKARSTKAKSRIDAFYDVKEVATKRIEEDKLAFDVSMSRIGGKILELHKLGKSFGDKKILNSFDYVFRKGEKVGIVGPNGTGKSTFLNMIMGQIEPDRGKVSVGETIVFGYYSQQGMQLKDEKRVIEVIKEIGEFIPIAGGKKLYPSQLLERFMFPSHMHFQYVASLSGGEKRRLYLLTILMKNPNFMILDEPTNDLDVFTLGVLEDYLESFEGCVLVVSHDRFFMDKLVDHIFVFEGDGEITDILGNYTAYRSYAKEQQQEKRDNEKKVNQIPEAVTHSPKMDNETEVKKRKPTNKEKFEYDQLNKDIPVLEIKKKELEEKLSSCSDHNELLKTTEELGKIISDLDSKSERWLELGEVI
jgi:ATP-binding cassette subfamily F protein uup